MTILKRLFFSLILNSGLLLILIIGVQNSNNKSTVDLLINKTIELPISFIVGISFISGSILGNFSSINLKKK